jgi:hypothetical protein
LNPSPGAGQFADHGLLPGVERPPGQPGLQEGKFDHPGGDPVASVRSAAARIRRSAPSNAGVVSSWVCAVA